MRTFARKRLKGPVASWGQTAAEATVGSGLKCWFLVSQIALIHGAWGGFWTSTNFESEWEGIGNQIAIPHALWLLTQAVNTLACRDPQLEWTEVWRFFDEHRMLASTMRPQTFPAGSLPRGQCWIPDFGLTKLQEYIVYGESWTFTASDLNHSPGVSHRRKRL